MYYNHRVSIDWKCPYMKILKGEGNFPSFFDNNESHTYKSQILVSNLAKKNDSCEEKLDTSILLNNICLQAYRLEINN